MQQNERQERFAAIVIQASHRGAIPARPHVPEPDKPVHNQNRITMSDHSFEGGVVKNARLANRWARWTESKIKYKETNVFTAVAEMPDWHIMQKIRLRWFRARPG